MSVLNASSEKVEWLLHVVLFSFPFLSIVQNLEFCDGENMMAPN